MSDAHLSEDLLLGLTPEQREAVTSPARRLLVRATAGSGKTHVLTLRIQRRVSLGELDAERILAMTFTRKAGDQLRQRLSKAGVKDVRAGTFHRAALQLVTQFRADHDMRPVTIEPSRRKLVSDLAEQLRQSGVVRLEEWQLPRIEIEIGWALSQGFNGTTYARRASKLRRQSPIPPAQFAELLDRYVGLCQSRGVLDFDLLLDAAITLLREEPAVLAAFRHRNQALFVDETQDMNPLQFDLLRQMAGDDPDLFCVGDPNQSIYGFNGANPAVMGEIIQTWPDTEVLDLTRNHRSTAPIVTVANSLLEQGEVGLTPAADDGALPLIRAYDTDAEEADHVALWIAANRQPGSPWRSMAVLARTNAQLELVEAALRRHDVPVDRLGADHSPASDLWRDTPARWMSDRGPNAVALSTIHRSKGLEWRHVAVIGFADGVLPHYNATTPEELAEEQRLAYVALTRAESSLLITWSRGRDDPRRPARTASRFLEPVAAALDRLVAEQSPVSSEERRARIAAIKEQLSGAAAKVALPPSGNRRPPR